MKLLKLILVIFLIYFVRRFMQFYRAMKRIQEQNTLQKSQAQGPSHSPQGDAVSAEFKVID